MNTALHLRTFTTQNQGPRYHGQHITYTVRKAWTSTSSHNTSQGNCITMSHCHDEHGGHDHSHDHDHDHSDDITPALQASLYQQINFDEITTLNESTADAGKAVVKKTWAERLNPEPELQSDTDEQLLMTVP